MKEIKVKKDFSVTFFCDYEECPSKAVFKSPFTENGPNVFGSIVHNLMEGYFIMLRRGKEIPFDAMHDIGIREMVKRTDILRPFSKYEEKLCKCMDFFKHKFLKRMQGFDILDIESQFADRKWMMEITDRKTGEVLNRFANVPILPEKGNVRCKIDRVDVSKPFPGEKPTVRIVDYKTGSTEAHELQPLIYAITTAKMYGLDPKKYNFCAEFWYLESGGLHEVPITEKKMLIYYDRILKIVESYKYHMNSRIPFPKSPSPNTCRFCDNMHCEEGKRWRYKK